MELPKHAKKDFSVPSNSKELPRKYNFKDIESKWKQFWQDNDTYKPQGGVVFSIDTPPPTVSGHMHMGHAFGYAQGDFVARFHRMKGDKVFYPFGTDDNGIPTEHLIERTKKVSSVRMPRHEFIKLCEETLVDIKPKFTQAWIDLGISADFKNSYSTIDKDSIRVSQQAFLDLYEKGLIKREVTPVAWSVKSQTAIAQAEFENVEKQSMFNDIAFHDQKGNELIISTTRPELIPACVGIFAHPDDKKYAHLKGKKAKVPLFDYEVPILYDEAVAMDKGTGLMMVCTFGDKEDIEKWYKHDLELRSIFTKYGALNELAGKYKDLKIQEARKAILEDLEKEGFLKKQEQITHNVNVYERDQTPIEFMVTPQWFVKILEHKEKLIKAADDITWHPEHMKVRYINWVEGLSWDWCISRQRHFGVPFPVWYEKDSGNIIVAKPSDLPIDPTSETPSWYDKPENLVGETDVMDTWATSSVSPQIALDREEDEDISKEYPMTLRLQGHDIIRTWAFYTIAKSLYGQEVVPWTNIMVNGFVLDSKGKKMSKSKGNVVDPLKQMDFFGSDALRYAASSVKLGEDIPYQDKYLETGKRLVTKLFNASKFMHMHLEDYSESLDLAKLKAIDKWIITKCNTAIEQATKHFNAYEFAKARSEIEKFFWNVCDNYLEIVKDRLYKPEIYGDESRLAGQMTLQHLLDCILKLFAPYMPYVTEEIYSWMLQEKNKDDSIHNARWPSSDEEYHFADEEKAGDIAVNIIGACRREKNNNNFSQKHEIEKLTVHLASNDDKPLLEMVDEAIKMTVSAKELVLGETGSEGIEVDIELAPAKDK